MHARGQSGVTLVELLVASILGSFLLIMAMAAWRPARASSGRGRRSFIGLEKIAM